jgi:hypothetical protein
MGRPSSAPPEARVSVRILCQLPPDPLILPAADADTDTLWVAVERIEYRIEHNAEELRFIGRLATRLGRPRMGGGLFHEATPDPETRQRYLERGREDAVDLARSLLRRFE